MTRLLTRVCVVASIVSKAQSLSNRDTIDNTDEYDSCGFDDHQLDTPWWEYKRFHARGRAALKAGYNTEVKALVWHCDSDEHCGGNGDQIKGLATALYIAIASDRVLLVDTWRRSNFAITDLLNPRQIDWTMPVELKCGSFKEIDWAYGHSWKPIEDSRTFSDVQCVRLRISTGPIYVQPEEGSPAMQERLLPVLNRVPHMRLQGCVFNFLFKRSPMLENAIAEHMPFNSHSPYVAVHLRFGDSAMAALRGSVDQRLPLKEDTLIDALRCAIKLRANIGLPASAPIVLLTDSADMKALLDDASFLDRSGLRGTLVGTTHGDHGAAMIPTNTGRQGVGLASSSDVINAWTDLMTLADASGIVKSWSSLSAAAAEIGTFKAGEVYEYTPHGCGLRGEVT